MLLKKAFTNLINICSGVMEAFDCFHDKYAPNFDDGRQIVQKWRLVKSSKIS